MRKFNEAEEDQFYQAALDRINEDYQQCVAHLKTNSKGQVDALSFQDFLSKATGRKINFHTDKGKMFWELTEEEWDQDDINCTCYGYKIKETLYGRNYDKIRIYINDGYNAEKERFDTSCWNKNVRAYRANIAKDADPEIVELANLIMKCWNKTPSYGVHAGEIYKSWIMKVPADGEFHKIGATLDIDRITQMGNYLKREVYQFETDNETPIGKRVTITFQYGSFSKVTIVSVIAPFCSDVSMKIEK